MEPRKAIRPEGDDMELALQKRLVKSLSAMTVSFEAGEIVVAERHGDFYTISPCQKRNLRITGVPEY